MISIDSIWIGKLLLTFIGVLLLISGWRLTKEKHKRKHYDVPGSDGLAGFLFSLLLGLFLKILPWRVVQALWMLLGLLFLYLGFTLKAT